MAGRLVRFGRWAAGWAFTTSHRRIGILYLWVTFLWFLFAGLDAIALRYELASPKAVTFGPEFYDGLFTFHGTQMLFLFAIPVFSAFGNFLVPTMVGAKEMAFPRVNSLALWLVFLSGTVLRVPLLWRSFAADGWTDYAPLSLSAASPSHGEDWWAFTVFLETLASTLGGINFLATILRRPRTPGPEGRTPRPLVPWGHLPVFAWSMLAASALAVVAGPFLLAALGMLFLDRHAGTSFFDPSLQDGSLLWQHLFWFYSHPATYIMILPAFGIVSHVLSTFSGNPLFSRRAVVASILGTTAISMAVFWHHMFTTGMDADYSTFASIMTMAVSLPTAVLFYNWLGTLWRGRIRFDAPMLFALGFIAIFGLGGIDGIYLASIPIDRTLHQTYWLIGHIHLVLFGSALGAITGVYYWFPRLFGRRMHEMWGKVHFWGSFAGALLNFLPMHELGLEGMVRRSWTYPAQFAGLNQAETLGAYVLGAAQAVFLANVLWTLLRPMRATDVPWTPTRPGVPEPDGLVSTAARPIAPPMPPAAAAEAP